MNKYPKSILISCLIVVCIAFIMEVLHRSPPRVPAPAAQAGAGRIKIEDVPGLTFKDCTFGYSFDDLLDAIEWVESKGDANIVGDGGKAIGSFQIHKIYVDDVNRIICKHRMKVSTFRYADRQNKDKSRIMVIIYLEEYAGGYTGEDFYTGVVLGDWQPEKMARIHNGGPDGWKKDCTTPYWEKVKARLDAECGDQYAKELMAKEVKTMRYVIKWKSKLTDKTGSGTKGFKKWDAAEQVARLNRKYPDIDHWYEESNP